MFDFLKIVGSAAAESILRPLNLAEGEYADHFEQPVPARPTVALVLLARDHSALDHAEDVVDDLEASLHSIVASVPELVGASPVAFVEAGDHWLWEMMSDVQRRWMVNGIYAQLCFYDITRAGDLMPFRSLANAETWLDLWVDRTESTEPADHSPIVLKDPANKQDLIAAGWDPEMNPRGYRLMINDLYRENVGLHLRALMSARNEILIRLRAQLSGQDPDQAWAEFVAAGHRYFLDAVN